MTAAIQIFDPALCCASGVCGTDVDQALVSFAADAAWATGQGAQITRFNLSQQPLEFANNATVKGFLQRSAPRPCRWCWWMAKWRWPAVTRSGPNWRAGRG